MSLPLIFYPWTSIPHSSQYSQVDLLRILLGVLILLALALSYPHMGHINFVSPYQPIFSKAFNPDSIKMKHSSFFNRFSIAFTPWSLFKNSITYSEIKIKHMFGKRLKQQF